MFCAVSLNAQTCDLAFKIADANNDFANSVAIDANGNFYVAGHFSSATLSFNNGTSLVNSGDLDAYIAKYNSSGICQWAEKIYGSDDEDANSISLDASGNLYIAGWFKSSTLSFNNGISLSNSGYYDAYIAKYEPTIETFTLSGSVKYPKYKTPTAPGVKTFSIVAYNQMPKAPWVKLYDSLGVQLDSTKADFITGAFAFSNIPNGKYTLVLDTNMPWNNNKPWQLSILDVNLTNKTVGLVYSFDELQKKAANVNLDYYPNGTPKVNIQDVNALNKRVGLVIQPSIWKISNYVYAIEKSTGMTLDMSVIINNADQTVNIRGLSAGDINGQ